MIIIYGAGVEGEKLLKRISGEDIKYFVDNDTLKQEHQINGIRIVSFDNMLKEYENELVVISTIKYEKEIIRLFNKYKIKNWCRAADFLVLKNNKTIGDKENRIILLNTNDNVNVGDHAIAWAEHVFFETFFHDYEVIEFGIYECTYALEKIKTVCRKKDLIVITGGGFLGSLWKNGGEDNVRAILTVFKEYKIIIFPQSMYFWSNKQGMEDRAETARIYNQCKNLTVVFRERNSYNIGKKILNEHVNILYVPDMVTFLNVSRKKYAKEYLIVCMREDKESNLNRQDLESVFSQMKEYIQIKKMSMLSEENIMITDRMQYISEKLKMIQKSKLVITDRLHCMLLCLISGTECIVIDNLTGKISGTYEWIKNNQYIHLMKENDISKSLILSFMKNEGYIYDDTEI